MIRNLNELSNVLQVIVRGTCGIIFSLATRRVQIIVSIATITITMLVLDVFVFRFFPCCLFNQGTSSSRYQKYYFQLACSSSTTSSCQASQYQYQQRCLQCSDQLLAKNTNTTSTTDYQLLQVRQQVNYDGSTNSQISNSCFTTSDHKLSLIVGAYSSCSRGISYLLFILIL